MNDPVKTKCSQCYCNDSSIRKCVYCQDAEDRQQEDRVCSTWNWNCSPRECAEQAIDLGWGRHTIVSAMKRFGFKQSNIDNVIYEFEELE